MNVFCVRDVIHDYIECSNKEKEIINSPLVQRLKWVMQLSAVYHVFNGGTHTRFAHSLGAMHVAGMYMTHLFKDQKLREICELNTPEHYIQVARLAGLLHDIGHGPFSHLFDHIVYQKISSSQVEAQNDVLGRGGKIPYGHDQARLDLIESDLLKPYILNCGVKPSEIAMAWSGEFGVRDSKGRKRSNIREQWIYYIIGSVVQGPLGADRIDFTLRDSYYTGTTHLGTIAHTRIISNSGVKITSLGLTLYYNDKIIRDVISALDGRLYLYHDVYFHKTSMAASILIEEMLLASCDELKLVERTKDISQFRYLNDSTIIGALVCSDSLGGKYCRMLLDRRLPKLVKEEMVNASDKWSESEYQQKWEATDDMKIVKTRVISGISPGKFEEYNIKFKTNLGELISCAQALDNIKFHPSQPPYYLVRMYSLY